MTILRSVLCAVLVAGLGVQALAQWSSNPTVNTAICTATRNQQKACIATDGAGGAIIAWLDQRYGSQARVFAQRVDANGMMRWLGGGIQISYGSLNCYSVAIASDGGGGAIVVWADARYGPPKLYAQRVNGTGMLQWGYPGLAVTSGADQFFAALASDGTGGVIIAWAENPVTTDIKAQRITFSGGKPWGGNGVTVSGATGVQQRPAIAQDASGGAVITWEDARGGGGTYDIYAQRVNASGIMQWTPNGIPVVTEAGNQSIPAVDGDGAGSVIIWTDGRDPSNQTVYAQRLSSTGTAEWQANGVLVSDQPHGHDPQILCDGVGGAYAVWRDYRIMGYPGGLTSIWLQHFDASGTPLWAAEGVSPCRSADQAGARLTGDGTGGVIVSWCEVAPSVDVFAQRLSPAGELLWGNRTYVSYASGSQIDAVPVSDGAGGVVLAWTDGRAGYLNSDIYAQRVLFSGLRAGEVGTVAGTISCEGEGLGPLAVALLSSTGNRIMWATPTTADTEGRYVLPNIPPGYWQVAIFEPLGYDATVNPVSVMVPPNTTRVVDFTLVRTVAENASRIKAYWEHQFSVYVNEAGVAQETEEQLYRYLREVSEHYSSHFGYFAHMWSFEEWLDVLQIEEDPPLADLARAQVAALVLNLASLRVGQYTPVARDGRTAGDVLTYVSNLLASERASDLSHAMVYASHVNNRVTIRAGAIPKGSILYRKGLEATNGAPLIPGSFALRDNYPNPFNPGTTIEYDLPKDAAVSVRVYDALGQEVATLVNQKMPAGVHKVHFDGSSLPSGVYLCRLQAADFVATKRLILVK